MKTLIVILALAFTANAQSVDNKAPFDDWQFLGQGQNRYGVINVHIAPKTISRNEDIVKLWLMATAHYGMPIRSDNGSYFPTTKFVRVPVIFDCKAKTARNGDMLFYDKAGQQIFKYTGREKAKEQQGTITWVAFEYFCEKEGKKLTGPPTLK